jgi:hypothetical protein
MEPEEGCVLNIMPYCFCDICVKRKGYIVEYGGNLRCFTSDGRIVNIANELNKIEMRKRRGFYKYNE